MSSRAYTRRHTLLAGGPGPCNVHAPGGGDARRDDEVLNPAPVLAEALLWLLCDAAGTLFPVDKRLRAPAVGATAEAASARIPAHGSSERDHVALLLLLVQRCARADADAAGPTAAQTASSSGRSRSRREASSPVSTTVALREALPSPASQRPPSASPTARPRGAGWGGAASGAAGNLACRATRVVRRLLHDRALSPGEAYRRGLLGTLLALAAGDGAEGGGAARVLRVDAANALEALFAAEEGARTLAAHGPPPGVVDALLGLVDAGVASAVAGGGGGVSPQAARALASILVRYPCAFDACADGAIASLLPAMAMPGAGACEGAAVVLLTLAGKDYATTLRIARDARIYAPMPSLLRAENCAGRLCRAAPRCSGGVRALTRCSGGAQCVRGPRGPGSRGCARGRTRSWPPGRRKCA